MGFTKIETGKTIYRDVTCDSCGAALKQVFVHDDAVPGDWDYLQADDALHLQLSGGYGEFIDLMDPSDYEDCKLIICGTCAKALVDAFPYLKAVVIRHLNLNIGHVCNDGELYWIPQPECTVDRYQHGWRHVFACVPVTQKSVKAGDTFFDTQEEADAHVAGLAGYEVRDVLYGWLREHETAA